jgi:hypothetical protein
MPLPKVTITEEWLFKAKELEKQVAVKRTKASDIDTLTGIIGEFAFAQWFYGDWRNNRVGENKGEVNFQDIEIKTSSFPFSNKLNLLVREDYAQKRKPSIYIQIIINVNSKRASRIDPGTEAIICGYAYSEEVEKSPLGDFGSKYGGRGGYRCHYISIKDLHPIEEIKGVYNE